jgi:hypothetical protein
MQPSCPAEGDMRGAAERSQGTCELSEANKLNSELYH